MVVNLRDLFPKTQNQDERSVSALLGAMKTAFSSEFDYLNFRQSIKSLSDMNLDESTMFKSAFATAATMGVTKEKLLSSIKKYKQVLSTEKEMFAEALKGQLHEKVDGRKEELEKVKKRIEDNLRKIEELKKENETLQGAIDNADKNAAEAKLKIEKRKLAFLSAFDIIEGEIISDKELINKYL